MKKFTSTVIALAAALATNAAVVNFTYNTDNGELASFGYDKKETVYVAIRIDDPSLVGAKVTSMSVPVTVDFKTTTLGQCTAFLTTELDRDGKTNLADICTENASIDENGTLSCTFSEPYTITDKGVYVGYSLPIESFPANASVKPVAVVDGVAAGGLYVFASRSVIQWTAKSSDLGAVSAMVVTLDADLPANAAAISLNPRYVALCGEKNIIKARISNFGLNEISSVEYSYTIGDKTSVASAEVSPAVSANFGATGTASLEIEAPAANGEYNMELTLTKVNGETYAGNTASAQVVVSAIPVTNRPLVEEFTGLWCGNCPLGYAALETLNEAFPGEFVALAYHNGDPMEVMSSYPVDVNSYGYPCATVNRDGLYTPSRLYSTWPAAADKIVNSVVSVDLSWANEEKTIIRSTTKVQFAEDQKGADYRIGACLVSDGLTNPSWVQSNYFSSNAPTGNKIFDELFIGTSSQVAGLVFNDVVLSFPNKYGKTNSLPAQIKAVQEVTYVEDFDLNKIRNTGALPSNPIQNIEDLRVVGVLFNSKGAPLNCASSAYSTAGGKLEYVGLAAPVIYSHSIAADGKSAEVTFSLPAEYIGGDVSVIPNGTPVGTGSSVSKYFRFAIYVNGGIYTFTPAAYPGLKSDANNIVFADSDVKNITYADGKMTVKVFADDIKELGVQSIYLLGSAYESQVTICDESNSISEFEAEGAAVRSVSYYDLQGREISAPRAGSISVCRMVMTDGSVRSSKVKY